MSLEVVYTSCSVNQVPQSAHWGKNNLICFASSHTVRIYDSSFGSGGKIIFTLYGHSKRVNSVRWLTGKQTETELISTSADGKAIVWSRDETGFVPNVICEHDTTINMADGYYKNPNTNYCVFVICTANNFINIYERQIGGRITLLQNVDLGKHVVITSKLFHLPLQNNLVIGIGTDTGHFILYGEDENGIFNKYALINAHSDWIGGLDFTTIDNDVLFSTASQDTQVKVWRIKALENCGADSYSARNDFIRKNVRFVITDVEYIIKLDSVLSGHDSWVYSVHFKPHHMELLSASIDKTLIIWQQPAESKIWVEKDRFGEIGNNSLGYLGGMFGPQGDIFAHGFFGSFHLWRFYNETGRWKPIVTIGGHTKDVVDIAWHPSGQFLYSMSRDQTTRIHAPWSTNERIPTWHEIARPQIHGYEMTCLALLSQYEYAAGAEEKVIRIFKAPQTFIDNLKRICNLSDDKVNKQHEGHNIPHGAVLPSLGLSNKAVYEHEVQISTETSHETNFVPLILHEPPTEEDLLQNTLWPETHKLYGHGYEILALAATHDGTILASACKATSKEHACILLWNTTSWVQIDKLESHNLSVTQLAFSNNLKHLLSVSRDRRWTVFSRDDSSGKYRISATTDPNTKVHTRIIWCCAWLPNSTHFATGSRDGKVVMWKENLECNSDEIVGCYCPTGSFLDLKGESVTALAVVSMSVNKLSLVAVGLESGIIHLYFWDSNIMTDQWKLFITIGHMDAHHKTVKKLAFRNMGSGDNHNYSDAIVQLASGSCDGTVRIFEIIL